jgi:periplasmic protein TonB
MVRLIPACEREEIGLEMKSAGIVAVVLIWVLAGCGGRTSPRSPTPARTASSRPARLRVSQGVMEQSQIRYVKPVYPGYMQKQGDVTVWFWIDTDGSVEKVTAVDGDPMLAQAAIEAVKQWKYTPYLLNGEPIEVETRAVVSFGK